MKDAKLSRISTSKSQAAFAKAMRRDMTWDERKLWKSLRWRVTLKGTHFRRQVPLEPYIADFCSYGAKLVIEVDGNQHGTAEADEQDTIHTAFIKAQGYHVLRFSNRDLMLHIDMVLDTISAALFPTPAPSPQGGGEKRGNHG